MALFHTGEWDRLQRANPGVAISKAVKLHVKSKKQGGDPDGDNMVSDRPPTFAISSQRLLPYCHCASHCAARLCLCTHC